MRSGFFISLLILSTFVPVAGAQKLVSGGKPKKAALEGFGESACAKITGGFSVCKGMDPDTHETKLLIRKEDKTISMIEGPVYAASSGEIDDFWAYRGDLDKDGSPEVVIAALAGISNGLGISTFEINIFRDPEKFAGEKPLTFPVEEFGEKGNFIFDARRRETLILLTYWHQFDNLDPKRDEGLYLTGKWFRYKGGRLQPVFDRPTLARRFLYSFGDERDRTWSDLRAPYIWLRSKNTHRFFEQPKERADLIAVRSGMITASRNYEYGSRGFTIKLDSGSLIETRLGYSQGAAGKDENRYNVTALGLSKQRFVFPFDLEPETVEKKITGRKVRLETYRDRYDREYSQIWLLDN